MWFLCSKEIRSFFSSLAGYLVLAIFALATALFLWILPGPLNMAEQRYATPDPLFLMAPWLFLFLVPAIAMRSFSEEKRSGTLAILYAQPLSDFQLILGKFFGVLSLLALSLLVVPLYIFTLAHLSSVPGHLDWGAVWGGVAGLLMLGTLYTAIAIFSSTLTDNQIVAFLTALLLSLFLYQGFEWIAMATSFANAPLFWQELGIQAHYHSIRRGVFDSRDLLYCLGVAGLFLVLGHRILFLRHGGDALSGSAQRRANYRLLLQASLLILLIIGSRYYYVRIDLTSGQRFSLSEYSQRVLSDVDEPLRVTLLLNGELPAEFSRLQRETEEFLWECNHYSARKWVVNRIDWASMSVKEREEKSQYWMEKGFIPFDVEEQSRQGSVKRVSIFAGLYLEGKRGAIAVNLLQQSSRVSMDDPLHAAVEMLEYEFISALRTLQQEETEKIAFLEGHGEWNAWETDDISRELSRRFQIDRGSAGEDPGLLSPYKVVIVAGPREPLPESHKRAIDGYLMQGGTLLWLADGVTVETDSLATGRTLAYASDRSTDDLLFTYGVRIVPSLILDRQCGLMVVSRKGNNGISKLTPIAWPFWPLLSTGGSHFLAKNSGLILARYASPIDTVGGNSEVQKHVLLSSSQAGTLLKTPAPIVLDDNILPRGEGGNSYPVAVLMEGEFPSLFRNNQPHIDGGKPITKSKPTRMIVISDADIIRNEVKPGAAGPMVAPLGYDEATRQWFGNRELITRYVYYLADEPELARLRNRNFASYPVNPLRMEKERGFWRAFHLAAPLLLLAVSGIWITSVRRRRYAQPKLP